MPQNKKPAEKNEGTIEKLEEKIEKPVKKAVRYLRIDEDRQRKVFFEIKGFATFDVTFALLTVFAGIIVALGLIIDNAAIVIGGMIIAPLFWPMLALAIAIIKGNAPSFRKNVITIFGSSLIIIIVSFIIGYLSPHFGESHQILLRTEPTLFELFVALAAGFIGAFAVSHPKLSANLAGVVAAIALVPPLSAMGILFARAEFTAATGAALLFATNFIAITFAAVMLFLSVGVRFPRSASGKSVAASSISWFVLFLIIITIPLTLIMGNIIEENFKQSTVREVIEEYVVDSEITDLSLWEYQDTTIIEATIRSPYDVTNMHVSRLSDILTAELEGSISLTINVVPTYQAGDGIKVLP